MFLSLEGLNEQMATMEKMARVSLYQIWFPFEMRGRRGKNKVLPALRREDGRSGRWI